MAVVFALAIGALVGGCTEDAAVGSSQGAATVGTPGAIAFGDVAQTGEGLELRFKGPTGAVTFVRKATGSDPLDIENSAYGAPLNKQSEQRAGWYSNTKWKCVDAERFAYDKAVSPDASQECYVEINPTGGQGFSVAIIGLDASGNGLKSWSGSPGPAPAPANGGAPQPVSAGPPRKVNVTMDHDSVLNAMLALHTQFNAAVQERNDCLKNARASGWLDVQAHYYCLLPYADLRTCYSTKLIEVASNPDPKVAATAPVAAYDACFTSATSGNAKWLNDNQQAVFKYIMFTKQALFDFELGSENSAINDYYAKIGEPRPRRVIDTYPDWLPDQPRYEVIRKAQAEAQKAEP
jgi:hypothetical protein